MGRQVFLVTAYRDADSLVALTRTLSTLGDTIIHVDAKSDEIDLRCIRQLTELGALTVSNYRVSHGSHNHVMAVIDLLREAVRTGDFSYVHLISGQDFPCRSQREFTQEFYNPQGTIHLEAMNLKALDPQFTRRLRYRYFHGNASHRHALVKMFMASGVLAQALFGIQNRSLGEFDTPFLGLLWSSLPRDAVEYVLEYIDRNPGFLRSLSRTHIPEEFFLASILMNSHLRTRVSGAHLRYFRWGAKKGEGTIALTESDLPRIEASGAFFCRRIESGKSTALVRQLSAKWNETPLR